jgi:hypothetical protein
METPQPAAPWRILFVMFVFTWGLTGCREVVESMTRFCSYSEFILPTPVEMAGAEFTVEKDAVQGVGHDANYSCLKTIGSIGNQIIRNELSETSRNWYAAQGVQSSTLRSGTYFELVHMVAVVKHGLGTIDSGQGPHYFLILKDDSGTLFYASLGSLGINKDDRFLSMKLPRTDPILINHQNFDEGRDIEHPSLLLRKIEPPKQGEQIKSAPVTDPTMPMGARPATPNPPNPPNSPNPP